MIDTENLLDSAAVAHLLGLSSGRAVSEYRRRYPTFPPPVIDMGAGRCMLWARADIEAWADARPRR